MSKWVVIVVGMVVGMVVGNAEGKYGGGTGEPNDPYQIWDANHMQAIGADANDWDKHFVLMADIDLSQFDGKDGREEFNIIGRFFRPFRGVFNGDEHTISNLTIRTSNSDVGLFGCISGSNAEVRNLGLIDPNVDGREAVPIEEASSGSLVGYLEMGVVRSCYAEGGIVVGVECVGGLVGCNDDTIIVDSYTSVEVVGEGWIGGLVGDNYGTLSNCYATGSVTGGANSEHIGGLAGANWGWDAIIRNCRASSIVIGNTNVGGIVGLNLWGDITNCGTTGSVEGISNVGGLVGKNQGVCYHEWDSHDCLGARITSCYSTAHTTGETYVGGLVGDNRGYLSACYTKDANTYGDTDVGGLAGYNEGTIVGCYSATNVSGDNGGLVGKNSWYCEEFPPYGTWCQNVGIIRSCLWDKEYSQQEYMCGSGLPWSYIPGGTPSSCGITGSDWLGKPTSQMMQEDTFYSWPSSRSDWDFINVWNIGENQTYPYLRTFPAGDINHDRMVNLFDFAVIADQWMNEE